MGVSFFSDTKLRKHTDNMFPYQSPDQVRECRQASSWSECVGPCYWSEGGKAPTTGHCDMLQKFIGPEAPRLFFSLKNLETLILKGFSKGHGISRPWTSPEKNPSSFFLHQLRRTIGTVVWRSTITTHLLKRFSSGLRTRELAERSKNGRLVWENATGSMMKLGRMVAAHMKRN